MSYMTEHNMRFKTARVNLALSRAELAHAVSQLVPAEHIMTEVDIARIERGVIAFPHQCRREALRQVLKVQTDADIGLISRRQR